MQKNLHILTVALFAITLSAQTIFAQNLPDLVITEIGTDSRNRVGFVVKNVGRGSLPDSVWTNKNPKSPSITFTVNGRSWGGGTIWKFDSKKTLKNPGGRILYLSNYVLKGDTNITATVDRFNQVRESNENNNTFTKTLKLNAKNTVTNNPTPAKGSFFRTNRNFDLNKIKTINTMQEHVQWVSETNPQDVGRRLRENGFTLLGGGIISDGGFQGTRLRAYVATKGNDVIVAFRGTGAGKGNGGQTFANAVVTDGNILMTSPSFFYRGSKLTNAQRKALVHKGFNIAYNKLRPRIIRALQTQKGKNVYAFGHSLGGAMATLFATDVAINYKRDYRSLTHIVSGSPRVGNLTFAQTFENKVPNNLRVMLNGDPVPTIPGRAGIRDIKKYIHAGRLLVLDLRGNIIKPKDIFVETKLGNFGVYHDNKNYLKSVNTFMQKAERYPQIYSRGTQIILDATRSERQKTK